MKRSEQKIDPKKLEQGAWVSNIQDMGDLRLKVRGVNNKDWRRMSAKLIDAVPRSKKVAGRIDPDELDRVNAILLRDCCLLDWDNNVEDDGTQIPYSKELADQYLRDPEWPAFREAVMWASLNVAQIGELEAEQDVKN